MSAGDFVRVSRGGRYLGLGQVRNVCRDGAHAYVRMCGTEALWHVAIAELETVSA